MSFNWKDYVTFAEDCLQRNGEACLRSSISRAYYGIFCIARNRKGYMGHVGHLKVIDLYKDSTNQDEQNIGQILDELRRKRNKADYEENFRIDRLLAERVVGKAKHALTLMGFP